MSENLYQASSEWSSRPDDERFWNVSECYQAALEDFESGAQGDAKAGDLRVSADAGRLVLEGKQLRAGLNNWSFGQLASRAGAPAGYLAELPATLAAQNLNHGLSKHNGEGVKILLRKTATANMIHPTRDGESVSVLPTYDARAITSGIYERVWDAFFLRGFVELEQKYGWRTPPARPSSSGGRTRIATQDDILSGGKFGLSINIGDEIAPAGVYRGDRDMFVFMVDDQHVIEAGGGEALARGFFFWNSEVGARSFGAMTFLYRHVCGNHIVWDAKRTGEIRFRHVGEKTQRRASRILEVEVKRYLESETRTEVLRIEAAKAFELGKDKDGVFDFLLGKRSLSVPKKTLEAAYKVVEEHPEDGSPRTAWGMAQGLTRLSQGVKTQDARDALDRQAGKVLELAF